jgi:hypothetical protein
MTFSEATAIGIPSGAFPIFSAMTVEAACTQTCVDCDKVMEVYRTAHWRFTNHVIRCAVCQAKAEAKGYSIAEAMFVV